MGTDELASPRESTERLEDARGVATLAEDVDDSWQSLQRGETVGRYVVLGRVGAGAMGEVFGAYDPDLDRKIALKLLKKRDVGGMPRMMREAQAIAKVVHPNVVAVFDVGMHLGRMFVAMEFVDGESLTSWLERPDPTAHDKLDVLVQAGRGLAAAHTVGIVHRDFKPDNVLLGRDGRARVVDFGLARAIASRDISESPTPTTALISSEIRLTQTGALMGTPAYMAPEQHLRLECDARSDQFAFCVTAWEVLYGVRPFTADTLVALTVRVTEGRMNPPPTEVRVPAAIRSALVRGLAVKPDERWPSMEALLAELTRDAGRRRRAIAIAGGLVAIGSSVGFLAAGAWQRDHTPCDPASSAIASVWNDHTRAAVKSAFIATDEPYATDVLRTVVDRLDRYRDRWSEEYVTACEATHVRAEQSAALLDRRMACLDERRRELAEVVDVLRNADAAVVLRGVETVSGLRAIDPCGDLLALQRGVTPPPSASVDAIAEIRAEVQAALVLDRAGRTQIAGSRFDGALERAQEIGWRPLEVELEATRQRLTKRHVDPDAEAARLRGVFDTALAVGDLRSAVEIANDLGWQWGYVQHDRERGLEWIATARAVTEQIDVDWLIEVRVLNNEAVIRAAARDFDGAAPLFERAIALADEHDDGGLRPVQLRANLAAFWAERGEYRRAADLLEETRVGYEALIGGSHPRIGDVYANLGSAYLMLADSERAARNFDRAQAILETALPPDHPQRAHVLSGMATLERMRGNRPRAIELARRALAIREAAKQDRETAQAGVNLATALLEGDHDEPDVLAEVDMLAARSVAFGAGGSPSAIVTPLLLHIDVALRRGDSDAAKTFLERAETAAEDPDTNVDRRLQVHALAVRVGLARKDTAAVKAAIDHAEAELLQSTETLALATDLFVLAKGRWEVDYDRERAIEMAERSLALLEKRKDESGRLDNVRAWLREHRAG